MKISGFQPLFDGRNTILKLGLKHSSIQEDGYVPLRDVSDVF